MSPLPLFLSLAAHGLTVGVLAWFLHREPRAKYIQLVSVGPATLQPSARLRQSKAASKPTRTDSAPRAPTGPAVSRQQSPPSESSGGSLPMVADELEVTAMPRLLSEVRVAYPSEARARGIQGVVTVDLLIDESGVVRESKIVEGPGFGLNEAALQAVRAFRFEPAKVQEKSVAVRVRYSYRFVLDH